MEGAYPVLAGSRNGASQTHGLIERLRRKPFAQPALYLQPGVTNDPMRVVEEVAPLLR